MSELTFDVGLAAKLKQAVIRNGITDLADIDWLCEGDNLVNMRRLRQGHVLLTVPEHLIDCDADPFNLWAKDGWTVEEHQKGGQWKFDPKQVEFFLASGQKGGKVIEGNNLRKELAKKPVFNANVLDYLLANPHLIPEEWKTDGNGNTRCIFFWGTIYRARGGRLYVRYLYWIDGRWNWSNNWLDNDWNGNNPAALRATLFYFSPRLCAGLSFDKLVVPPAEHSSHFFDGFRECPVFLRIKRFGLPEHHQQHLESVRLAYSNTHVWYFLSAW